MLISKEILAKIKRLQIKTDKLASEILSGEYKSAFRGKGLNFDKIREYFYGDDIRNIDWKVTARMQSPFLRQYREERQLSVMLIVDLSASNNFGTQIQSKKEMMVELASVLASLAIKNNDKVGLILATDVIEYYVPTKQGKAHIFRIIKDLLTFRPSSKKTNLKLVLNDAIRLIPRNSVVFLISDFVSLDANASFEESFDYINELKLLNKTHDLIAISVRDPREFELPEIGFIEIVNPETNHKELMNLNRRSTRELFSQMQTAHVDFLTLSFKKLGIDFLRLDTGKAYIQRLLELFLRRERRS